MATRIAVGLDGSEPSWKAVREALGLAKHYGAELHIVSIEELVEASYNASEVLAAEKTARENLEQMQSKAKTEAEGQGVTIIRAIWAGNSTTALAEYVKKKNIELLVIGDRGHSSVWDSLLGTTAEKIVRVAPCSVFIVR